MKPVVQQRMYEFIKKNTSNMFKLILDAKEIRIKIKYIFFV